MQLATTINSVVFHFEDLYRRVSCWRAGGESHTSNAQDPQKNPKYFLLACCMTGRSERKWGWERNHNALGKEGREVSEKERGQKRRGEGWSRREDAKEGKREAVGERRAEWMRDEEKRCKRRSVEEGRVDQKGQLRHRQGREGGRGMTKWVKERS